MHVERSHGTYLILHAFAVSLAFSFAGLISPALSAEPLQYNRDVRPILAENCFRCHGPDSASRAAGLRLDRREDALEMKAFVAGDGAASEIIERVYSTDPDSIMPPPNAHKVLSNEQKEILKRWIDEGAVYQPHWSFIAPSKPVPPQVSAGSAVRNPIDQFVLAKLQEKGLSPAAEADRSTLARRVSLDLTGLPPAPEVVNEFVADRSPDAYEKLIDRFLQSPQWGEHRARYWLDAARYADTHGIHFDNFREIWAYREWVIGAYNRNVPFDQFTVEQLAGDLLPNRTLDQQIASGFNRCNMTTNEGGIIDEEYKVLYARDRTETTSIVWMGLTVGCAVCHDHKFDPITQREFYELSAFFNNTTQPVRDGNVQNTPPIVIVPTAADRTRWESLGPEIVAAQQSAEYIKRTSRSEFDQWATPEIAKSFAEQIPTSSLVASLPLQEGAGQAAAATVKGTPQTAIIDSQAVWEEGPFGTKAISSPQKIVDVDDCGDFGAQTPYTVSAWVKLVPNSTGAILAKMDEEAVYRGWDLWVQGNQLGGHLIDQWPNAALKVVTRRALPAGEWLHVVLTYDGSGKAEGLSVYVNGTKEQVDIQTNTLASVQTPETRCEVPFRVGQRSIGSPASGVAVSDVKLYETSLPVEEVSRLYFGSRYSGILNQVASARLPADDAAVFEWWLTNQHEPYREARKTIESLTNEENVIKSRGTIAHVMQEDANPAMAYVLFRGEYDKRRDEVRPSTPAILPPLITEGNKDRLALAKWLTQENHPLTARVFVNRAWQEVFGQGLVGSSGDFGVTGEQPSHPELLDWLAVDFREHGWDIKRLYKQLLMSATYRQSATATPEKIEADPTNRWLARGPRFRMDGEVLRDSALAASGLLVNRIGGPSVRPYQPPGVWEAVAMIGSNTRDYQQDHGENLYRRSMYTFWKRAAPPASMEIFNATSRETCTVKRERTNTPLQALVTLNDPQFVEAARVLAEKAIVAFPADEVARLDDITMRLLSRKLNPEERAIVTSSLASLVDFYKANELESKQLLAVGEAPRLTTAKTTQGAPLPPDRVVAAWTMLTNELMNLDEALCK